MKVPCMPAPTASLRLLILALCAFLACASEAAAASCFDFQPFTLKIYNSSAYYNIHPVITTPTNGADEWLQGGFQVPTADIATRTYGHDYTYRIYIKPVEGIPPGGFVTVSLPLCTQLVGMPGNGTTKDEWINWWNGGRVYIYASPVADGKPPVALAADWAADQKNGSITQYTPGPYCVGCSVPQRPVYKSKTALPANDPAQLTEYTLGALDKTNFPYYSLSFGTVDYDISYVDHVYLPVAMGPIGNPDIGWIGSIYGINRFILIMVGFLGAQVGWPQYLDPIIKQKYLRIPGTYNAFAQWDPMNTTTITQPGAAITDLKSQWLYCTNNLDDTTEICQDIHIVHDFFATNYSNYLDLVAKGSCTPPTTPPAQPVLKDMLKHVYGWVPWNEHCSGGAKTNDLALQPDFAAVHRTYISLQYLAPLGAFNPYVNLVHGKDYLDMPGSYAFSIDDDVGNMLVHGSGIIITIAGTFGLENTVQFDKSKIVHVQIGDPIGVSPWQQYGFCDGLPTRNVKDLSIQITSVNYPCTFALSDQSGRSYRIQLAAPPYPATDSTAPILACSTTPASTWCNTVTAKTQPDPVTGEKINYVQAGPPPS